MSESLLELPATMRNPVEPFLRMDRMPHIWCPACGIGTTVNCFTRALESSKLDLDSGRMPRVSKVQRISAENSFLRHPTDPAWVFGYDAITVPLGPQQP